MEDLTKDIIVSDTIEDCLHEHENKVFTAEFVRIVLCEQGQLALKLDGRDILIRDRDMLICAPGVSVSGSPDGGRAKMLAVRYARFLQAMRTVQNIWTILLFPRMNPVFPLPESEKELTLGYYNVIKGKLSTVRDVYFDEILMSLMQCAIFEICVILSRSIGDTVRERHMDQKELLFKRFLEQLNLSGGRERSVSAFADRLCVSPKYLSAVTSTVCGRSAHELILEQATQQILRSLKYSKRSIKEIAADFQFPDLSSFGKFVRTRTGHSPREIRG